MFNTTLYLKVKNILEMDGVMIALSTLGEGNYNHSTVS